MKKNKIIIFNAIILSQLILISCNKKKSFQSTVKKVFEIVNKNPCAEDQQDFTIFISGVHPISVLQPNETSNTNCIVQCFSKSKVNIGNLTLNEIEIPFTASNIYSFQTDSLIKYHKFLGTTVTANFKSNSNKLKSFTHNFNTSKVVELNYKGLTNNRINSNIGFEINWLIDSSNLQKENILQIEGELNNETISEFIMVKELQGKHFIEPAFLSKFKNCKSIQIQFFRENDTNIIIDKKTVKIRDINFSWSRIFFN